MRVGDISPGGCRRVKNSNGLIYCGKHEMPCRNGCKDWAHLKNQEGCGACVSEWKAQERKERAESAKKKDGAKSKENEKIFNPEKGKKKPQT